MHPNPAAASTRHRFPAHRRQVSRLDPWRQSLAADPVHLRLAGFLAKKHHRKVGITFDEAKAAALFGLCEAARTYDSRSEASFSTFAAKRIGYAILDDACERRRVDGKQTRTLRSNQSLVSLSRILFECEDGRTVSLAERIESEEDSPEESTATHDLIESLLSGLSDSHKTAMRLLYCHANGIKVRQAAKLMGISESRVSQLRIESIGLIRERFADPARIARLGLVTEGGAA